MGRLTEDPQMRYTPAGEAVANFTLAVNRTFTNKNGDREADFIRCVAWRKPAELISNYTKKGSQLGIDGRIQTRTYRNQADQQVYATEVVVENFSLLGSKNSNQKGQSTQNQPQNKQKYQNKQSGQPIDVTDDDLPF